MHEPFGMGVRWAVVRNALGRPPLDLPEDALLACDLRTTSVPSDFLPWATPWRFLPWISPWRCESGPRTCEVPIDDEAVRFLCCSEVLRPEVPLGQGFSDSSSSLVRSLVSW